MVENPTHKSYEKAYSHCLWLSLGAIAFTSLWCIWWSVQSYYLFEDPSDIKWQAGIEVAQVIVFALYAILPFTLLAITVIFCVKLLRGLKAGEIFSLRCTPWLVAWGMIFGITDFIQYNAYMWGVEGVFSVMTISPSTIVVPVFVLIFAALFRLAATLSEDSNLAI